MNKRRVVQNEAGRAYRPFARALFFGKGAWALIRHQLGYLSVALLLLSACTKIPQTSPVNAPPDAGSRTLPTLSPAPATYIPGESTVESTEQPQEIVAPDVANNIEPFAAAPECPETAHDVDSYHGLWDSVRGCHFAHTHNADPAALDTLFGPPGEPFGGQSLSYPHQTPLENVNKHQGYKWDVTQNDECLKLETSQNCVMDFRIQIHVIGGAKGAVTRFHSYWAEILVCRPDSLDCGTIKTGGWGDFGILEVPYKGEQVPLDTDPPSHPSVHVPPYRGHRPHQVAIERSSRTSNIAYTWNSSSRYGYNQILEYDFRSADDWGGITPEHPDQQNFICPDNPCIYNHSELHIYEIVVRILPAWDKDGDGFVDFRGFTDVKGNLQSACHQAGPNCVPLVIENGPVGNASFSVPGGHAKIDFPDYDVYFNGQTSGWIQYPN